jgi:hypothetical protein
MSEHRTLKSIHLVNTVWFILCVAYILVLALRQAGVNWWIIFSLSGHSALLIFLVISLYLFAIFRGAGRSQKIEAEHPLTSTNYYMALYVIAPLLGSLAGYLGMIKVYRISQFLLGIAMGTLATTFLVWVIVDPVTTLLEMLLPASRKHRSERLAQVRKLREIQQEERKRLLAKILTQENQNRRQRQQVLQPHAEQLAGLLLTNRIDFKQAERKAVDIGVNAWQIGGLSCMQQLHDMAIAICKKKHQEPMITDYISGWWNGIGSWQNPSFS